MTINKKFSALTLTLASTLLLAACGGGGTTTESSAASSAASSASSAASSEASSQTAAAGELQDGTYTLETKDFDENGWKVNFSMTVAGGEITESNYDYVNAEGALKSEDEDYQKRMSDKVGVGPQEYLPELNQQLVETQDPEQVEVVSGATSSSESFKKYAQMLIDAAKEGNTEKIVADAAE